MLTPPSRRRRGFTLPELIAVIAIMGIIAAMAAPRMNRWIQTISQRSASNQLVADLGWARAFAAREGRSVSLRVVNATTYQVTVDSINGDVSRELKKVDLSQVNHATTFSSELVGGRISFDSRGILGAGSTTRQLIVKRGTLADTVHVTEVGRPYRAR